MDKPLDLAEVVEYGMEYDRMGYPDLALWLACYVQTMEAMEAQ